MELPEWWKHKENYVIMDCLEGMKDIPDNSVDLILTDPPFNVGIDYGKNTNDVMNDSDYSYWIEKRLLEFERIIKNGKPIIIFTGDKKIYSILNAVKNTNLMFHHHFFKWNKPSGQRGLSGWVLFNRTELALLLTKGKPQQNILNRKILYSDTLIHENTKPNDKDAVNHPCRRPTKLYSHIIKGMTKKNDIILDPFLGSGTTLLACKETNRIGLGFEINPEYESIIRDRTISKSETIGDYF